MTLILFLGFINFGCGIPIIKKKKKRGKKKYKKWQTNVQSSLEYPGYPYGPL